MSSEKVRFIREVVIRYVGQRRRPPRSMTQPKQIAAYLRRRVRDDAREHLVAIYLDARLRPIGDAIVSIGTANSTAAHPREVFQIAVALGACALLVAHCHPSGDVRPSDADLAVTRRLACAGRLLGIELLDHIVWTRGGEFRSIAGMCPEAFRSGA
jgi:DNA repair protein RadC